MINDSKRLKRGLKDISPLFDQDREIKLESRFLPKTSQPVQSLAVFCPEDPSKNISLSVNLASKMKAAGGEGALISIRDEKMRRFSKPVPRELETKSLKHFILSLEQFQEACRLDCRAAENFGSSVFFIDFNYANPIHFKKVMPMLDQWLLFLRPELESLSEAFKFIKASLALNHNLEYFIAYYGPENPQKAALLYERFSEMVSRRMSVGLTWLGCFDDRIPGSLSGLSLEALQIHPAVDSVEKRGLAGFVYPELRLNE